VLLVHKADISSTPCELTRSDHIYLLLCDRVAQIFPVYGGVPTSWENSQEVDTLP